MSLDADKSATHCAMCSSVGDKMVKFINSSYFLAAGFFTAGFFATVFAVRLGVAGFLAAITFFAGADFVDAADFLVELCFLGAAACVSSGRGTRLRESFLLRRVIIFSGKIRIAKAVNL